MKLNFKDKKILIAKEWKNFELNFSKDLKKFNWHPLKDVEDFQGNLKDLTEDNCYKLAKSIYEFGFTIPFFAWKDKKGKLLTLDGHQRRRFLTKMFGDELLVPVVYIPAENRIKAKKQLLAINSNYGQITKDGWDEFVFDLTDDDGEDWIKETTTFDNWLDIETETEIETKGDDEIPAEPKNIFVVRGDIFEIKANGVTLRVGCLDSTNADDIEKLMNGNKTEIAFTSPPYNAGTTPTEIKMNKKSKYENDSDDKTENEYLKFLIDFTNNSLLFSEYSFVNIQSLSGNKTALIDYLYNLKSLYADTIIWNKQNSQPAMAENVLNSQFEYIHIFSHKANRSIGTKKFRGTLKNIIEISKQNNNEIKEHNATFSVEFALYFVENFCEKSVLDLFCGSGTTALACLKTKRNCFTNDISENYVQVSVKRILDFCEKNNMPFEITLNGESFDVEKLN